MNKLKALANTKNQPVLCYQFQEAYESVDLDGMNDVERMEAHGMPVLGEPALSIDNGVATIKVRGILAPNVGFDASTFGYTGYDVIEHYLAVANSDTSVSSIILDVDSPGGSAKGCADTGDLISNSAKPVNAFVSGNAYSAGYWLAAAAKSITAKSTSGIGSIGAVTHHADVSQSLKNEGVSIKTFASGFWKDAFSGYKPLTKRAESRLQQDIDKLSQGFFKHVSTNRNITVEAIQNLDADCFDAEDALNIGLIDAVQTATGTKVASNNKASNALSSNDLKPTEPKLTQPLISQEDDMAATEKQLATARAEARAEAIAEVESLANAKAERLKQIYALEADDKVKEALTADAFADVDLTAITSLVGLMPKGFTQIMDDEKGAGVEASPTEFAEKSESEIKAEAQAAAAEKMSQLNMKGVI